MKIEFYHKVTGDIYDDPKQFIIDHEGNVYYDYGDCYAPHIGWRIIDQWQPIETAPKDGIILVLRRHRLYPTIATWDSKVGLFENDYGIHIHDATHWMPLPPNPQSSESNPQS